MLSLEKRGEQAPGGEHSSKNRFKEPEGPAVLHGHNNQSSVVSEATTGSRISVTD